MHTEALGQRAEPVMKVMWPRLQICGEKRHIALVSMDIRSSNFLMFLEAHL